MKVLICDPISPKGIELFRQRPEFQVTVLDKRLSEAELLPLVADVEAMVVRSETKVTKKVLEAAPKLRVSAFPTLRADASSVSWPTGKLRFSRVLIISTPTAPVAPATATCGFRFIKGPESRGEKPPVETGNGHTSLATTITFLQESPAQ